MKKIYLIILAFISSISVAQMTVSQNQTAINLASALLGGGVTITNPTLTCAAAANGTFTGGSSTGLGFNQGVILSTGNAVSVAGVTGNLESTNMGTSGIPAMGSSTYDGCYLGFQIVPKCNSLNIRYRFASEEYYSYVGSSYNDAFGFFISGPNPSGGNYTNLNMATVPGFTNTGVSVNTINNGNSPYTGPCTNCGYFSGSVAGMATEGFTSILTASANVTPCQTYTLFMALVDRSDQFWDSQVFLERSGVYCTTPTVNVSAPSAICAGQSATLTASGVSSYTWSTGSTSSSIVVTPSSTTSYTVGGSNIGTCIQDSRVVTINVNTAPTAVTSPGGTLTCANTTTVLSSSGGGTYSWSGPGIVSGGNTATPTINQPGNYTLVVTSAASPFCSSLPSVVSVSQNTTVPTPTASNTGTLTCTTTNVSLSASGGGTYSWSGAGIVSGGSTANPVVNGAGPYVVTVTAANGCTATANTSVPQNTTAPSPTASNSTTLTCSTTTAALTATGGGTYSWSGAGIISGAATANPVVSGTGPYVVTVTAANGCTATANTSVSQNTTAPSPTASNSTTLTCSTTTAALTATGGGTYSWSGTGIISGAATANPVVSGTGPYVVTVTAANGCTAIANTSVSQNTTAPSPTASNSTTLTCSTTTAALTATGGGTYSWSGAGVVSGANTANPVVDGTGPYVVTVTAANGCTATANTSVSQNTTAPSANATNSGSLTCIASSVNLNSTGGGTYSWSGPGISGSNTTAATTATTTGVYIVTVTAANGCTATANTTVTQNTITPVANAGSSQTLVCGVSSVTLSGSATPAGSSATWLGGVCGNSTSFTTTACAPGTYTLLATVPASGCTHTSVVTVSSSTNVPQATVNAVTNSITCTNSVVTIGVTLSNSDPVNYSWSGPGISGSTNTSTTTATIAGTYSVTITNTSSNCQSIFNVIVPTNTAPVNANATSSTSITCNTTSLTLSATPTGTNYSYNWFGPGTIADGTTANPTVDAGGNYVVTITDNINGCVGSYTATVASNTAVPSFSLGTASTVTTTCSSPNATLSATSNSDPNTVYTWATPGGTTLNGSSVIVSTVGIYTVVVTNTVNGCSTSSTLPSTVEVIADAGVPAVTLSTNSVSITCSNPTVSVAVSTTASPVSYNWSPSTGIVSGTETTANPVFNAPGTYSAVVTNTATGCATSISGNIVTVVLDNTPPAVTLSSAVNNGTITCGNLQVSVSPTVTPSTNLTYTWAGGSGISTPVNQSSATFTAAGVYTLAVTNTVTGCVSSSTTSANTFTVYVDNLPPTATISAISTNTVIGCGTNSSTVTLGSAVNSTNTSNLLWLPGNETTNNISVTTAGIYTLVVTDAVNSCSTATQFTVDGNTNPPQNVDAGTSISMACGSTTVVLNGTSTSTNVSYSWNGPSSTSINSGGNTTTPEVNEIGLYTLTVTDNLTGCISTATVNVTQANVNAAFSANPTSGLSPLDVAFTNASTGSTTMNYSWDFNDSNTSTSENPNHTFTTGAYTVTLTVTSGVCVSTATTLIVVEDGLTLEIPNVFTPNGDTRNDIFTIKSTGVKEITLQIFNRWGQNLYEFAGPKASWDGQTPSGADAPEGTYFYFVKATGFDGKEIEKQGTVSLFR